MIATHLEELTEIQQQFGTSLLYSDKGGLLEYCFVTYFEEYINILVKRDETT